MVLIFGLRIENDQQPGQVFSLNVDKVDDAKATIVRPVVLLRLRKDDFPRVLQHVFFELRALPDETFERAEERLLGEIQKVMWNGNWDRIEMFTAHMDAELRAANAEPRTAERPGLITAEIVRRVIDKMCLNISQ
jgi:hypothetical protein